MSEPRRARLYLIERNGAPLPEPELASVIEPELQSRTFGLQVRFTVERTHEGGFEVHDAKGLIVHNGVPSFQALLRDGDRIGAGDAVFRIDVEGTGALDDVVVVGGELLAWRVAGDNTLLRAISVERGYAPSEQPPLEVVRLFASFRGDLTRYEALASLAPKRIGLALGHTELESAFLVRTSTRGARAAAIVARPDGAIDDAVMLVLARALLEGRERADEVVPLEHLALTFEGDVVVAALADHTGPGRASLIDELGRLGKSASGRVLQALRVATSLAMSEQESTTLTAVQVLDEAIAEAGRPDAASLAAMVKRLFPDGWAAEERWREEAALLDLAERRRLAIP